MQRTSSRMRTSRRAMTSWRRSRTSHVKGSAINKGSEWERCEEGRGFTRPATNDSVVKEQMREALARAMAHTCASVQVAMMTSSGLKKRESGAWEKFWSRRGSKPFLIRAGAMGCCVKYERQQVRPIALSLFSLLKRELRLQCIQGNGKSSLTAIFYREWLGEHDIVIPAYRLSKTFSRPLLLTSQFPDHHV